MIQFRSLALARGARVLFEQASLQLHPGWRVGVIGANGSGKSSLFALLRGELHAEQGTCELPAAWRIASVAQETPPLPSSAIDYVMDGDVELRALERELATAEERHDGHRIGELHASLDAIGGYGARARVAALMAGLGFSNADLSRPVAEFSGGWRMRLNLAQALASRADLLLLDEPTNHLDLDAIVWLERWLFASTATLLLVSHDRDFLDATTSHTLQVADGRLKLYTGNYSAFEVQRAAQLAVQQAMFEKQQRQIAHLNSFIERFRAQATKARQAQSRIKALGRMELTAAAHVDTPFDFEFPEPARAPDPVITIEDASVGYGDTPILSGVQLPLRAGSRIGLLGPNGAGKSTLVKVLAGELAPQHGRRVEGQGVQLGYFAQHQLEQLRPNDTPLQHLARLDPTAREQQLRDYLGGFDFGGAMADAIVGRFSGGEKSRLVLAMLVRSRPNLLLLDEPTNHLDLEMRHALTRALAEYAGALVLVSHDRALLRAVCDTFMLVVDGRVQPFDGDLDDYVAWLAQRRASAANTAAPVAAGRVERQAARDAAAAERQAKLARRRPLVKESEKLDRQLERLRAESATLEAQLADPSLYAANDPARIQALSKRQGEVSAAIAVAEERWLEVHLELEGIGAA